MEWLIVNIVQCGQAFTMSLSPISVLVASLGVAQASPDETMMASLVEAFRLVADPRGWQGRRYRLAVVLALVACGVCVGQRSVLAVHDWLTNYWGVLSSWGLPCPSYDTLRRHLAEVDGDELDAAVGQWALNHACRSEGEARLVVAIDGKELRGAKNGGGHQTRLLAAMVHDSGSVIGQVEVGVKTNEIPKTQDLLDQIGDIRDMVITMTAVRYTPNKAQPA